MAITQEVVDELLDNSVENDGPVDLTTQAGLAISNATQSLLRVFRQVFVAYSNLSRSSHKGVFQLAQQDATELDGAVRIALEALVEYDKKLDEAQACLQT